MPKRKSRLAKKTRGVADSRLRSAMVSELQNVSVKRLNDYLKSSPSVRASDPILQTYYDLAKVETKRRAELLKVWGKESPKLPSPTVMRATAIAGELEAGAKSAVHGIREAEEKLIRKVRRK